MREETIYRTRYRLGLRNLAVEWDDHVFRAKYFRHRRMCDHCSDPIPDFGSYCRHCKFACHKECEAKVDKACDPGNNYEQRNESILRLKQTPKSRSTESLAMLSPALEAMYVTDRIVMVVFPEGGTLNAYNITLKPITRMLRAKHGDNYWVFNLSERRGELTRSSPQVLEYGWPRLLAPPLERLCSICKALDTLLSSGPAHTAVIHSVGDRGRAGVVLGSYLHFSTMRYNEILASSPPGSQRAFGSSSATENDRSSIRSFYTERLIPYMTPSQKRYVQYFASLLTNALRLNNCAMYLTRLTMIPSPNYDGLGGCQLFIKIYQGLELVFTTPVYLVRPGTRRVVVRLDPTVQLRGDIVLKAYHWAPPHRMLMFRLQIHTIASQREHTLIFNKDDLDDPPHDSKIPADFRLEMQLSSIPGSYANGFYGENLPVAEEILDPWTRSNSYEHFEDFLGENDRAEDSSLNDSGVYPSLRRNRSSPNLKDCLNGLVGEVETESKIVQEIYSPSPPLRSSARQDWRSPRELDMISGNYGPDWLNKQQEKLRTRREGGDDRMHREHRMLEELRMTQKRYLPERTPSPPMLAKVTTPLHVQTRTSQPVHPPSPQLPSRTTSRDITRTKYRDWPSSPRTRPKALEGERPWVSVRQAYQERRPGLLATVENRPRSPTSIRLDELEEQLQDISPVDSMSPPTFSPGNQAYTSTPKSAQGITTDSALSWSPSALSSGSPPPRPASPVDRSTTPGFPQASSTPYVNRDPPVSAAALPPRSPAISRRGHSPSPPAAGVNGQSSLSLYSGQSDPGSLLSLTEPSEVITSHPTFVKDSSRLWYRPNISRDEAIDYLRNKPAGTFIIRDSNSFPGAYGLALKVATPPAKVQPRAGSDPSSELVRHFLIETTPQGVRIKGCPNEPVFGSLAALVYQHSILPMALPCRLIIPEQADEDFQQMAVPQQKELLQQGAACSVIYLNTVDTECLTGPQAVKRALAQTFTEKPSTSQVHFKVSSQGITITDNDHKLFFRRHYPIETVSHCGLDPEDRKWVRKNEETGLPIGIGRCFGFVAKKPASKTDNQCHVFAELDPEQPAQAIVNFVSRVMSSALQEHQQKVQEQESF